MNRKFKWAVGLICGYVAFGLLLSGGNEDTKPEPTTTQPHVTKSTGRPPAFKFHIVPVEDKKPEPLPSPSVMVQPSDAYNEDDDYEAKPLLRNGREVRVIIRERAPMFGSREQMERAADQSIPLAKQVKDWELAITFDQLRFTQTGLIGVIVDDVPSDVGRRVRVYEPKQRPRDWWVPTEMLEIGE